MAKFATNLNQPPYFDNFDEFKQYYRYLFKPGIPVQTRELAGIQAMLQDQINKFGRNIYKEGSVVEGIKPLKFDYNNMYYVRIADTFSNGSAINNQLYNIVSSASSNLATNTTAYYVVNQNNLTALVVSANVGSVSAAPNTNVLFVKYINTALYPNTNVAANSIWVQSQFDSNDSLKVINCTPATLNVALGNSTWLGANISVLSNTAYPAVGNVTGKSYALHCEDGVIFHKGAFIYVPGQSVIVTPYSGTPDGLSVGFNSVETIITPDTDEDLNDNADGSPNFSAPGADALKIVPYLAVVNTSAVVNSSTFFSLVDFKFGQPTTILDLPEYSTLGIEFARRTYETNGDFVVKPFVLYTTPLDSSNASSNTLVNLNTDKGLGYVEGYRVEHPNRIAVNLRRATDYANITGQVVTANFGYYVDVQEYAGSFLSNTNIVQVELHNATKTAVSSGSLLSVSYSSATKIGTAYVKGINLDAYSTGSAANNTYKVYLFNVQMSAGYNFKDVKSIINYNAAVLGVADVVQTYNATAAANIAQIQDPAVNQMVFPFGQNAIKLDGFKNTSYVYRGKATATVNTTGGATISVGANVQGSASETFNYGAGSVLSATQEKDFLVIPTTQGLTANLTGNVTTTSGSNSVTGSGTTFLSDYNVGEYIGIYTTGTPEIKLITSITNNTLLTLSSNITTSNTTTRHCMAYPTGFPINFANRSTRTITIGSPANTATVALSQTMQASFNIDVWAAVKRSSTYPAAKVINKGVYVKIDCSNNAANNTGPWCLGFPDVLKITGVWVGAGGSYSNSGVNVKDAFVLDNGQRDSHYDLSYISTRVNSLAANSTILVELQYFSYDNTQGVGFFTGNSYPVDPSSNTANTNGILLAEIPLYTTQKGTTFDLRDCVDFRPHVSNTVAKSTTVAGAAVNPGTTITFGAQSGTGYPFLPMPDAAVTTDIQYFLSRVDRAIMDTQGNLIVVEGKPDTINPQPPEEPTNTMTLGLIKVPPYPSLSTPEAKAANRYDYAISCEMKQNRRYTMRDIGVLDQRITNVEYYTSLNLLEQSAQQLLVRNNSTGQNRFRNGIFVDPFNGFDLSNTNDPTFNIAIDSDRSEIRPRFLQNRSDLSFDSVSSTNVVQKGELIMLTHTSNNAYITQPYASKYRNCIDGNVFEWKGTVTLNPWGVMAPDLSVSPDVVNNIDLAANWVTLGQAAFGTSWGNWVDTSTSAQSSNTVTNRTNADGSTTTTILNQTVTTTQQQRNGQSLGVQTTQNQYNLGTFVTNVSLLPYLKPTIIKFTAHGMKPNTRVYVFFGDQPVSSYCAPTKSDFTGTSISKDSQSGIFGDPLFTTSTGDLYGIFYLPANTFRSEEIIFKIADVDDLVTGGLAISTIAQATFYGSRLAFSTATSILNTREAVLQLNELTDTRTLHGVNTSVTTSTTKLTNPPVIVVPPSTTPGDYTYWTGGTDAGSAGDCGCGSAGGE